MLDIHFIRQNPQKIRQACQDKQLDPQIVDQLLEIDQQRRQLQQQIDQLRARANRHAEEIKNLIQKGEKPRPQQIQQGKKIKEQIKKLAPQLKEIEEKYRQLLLSIPNLPAEDVPIGKDENDNQVIKKYGEPPRFDFPVRSHEELLGKLNLLDQKQGVKVAGFRGYYLKGDAFLLHRAIMQLALDQLLAAGFEPLMVPHTVNEPAMIGTGYFPWGKDDHYYTQDGTILTGSSEVGLTAYHTGRILKEKDLPIKMTSVSTCFRREVGSYGKDTKGIIRVHQFEKVEQVVYTAADEEETRKWHQKMLNLSEKLLQSLELPYRVLLMCTGDMGAGQRKKYDIETWFPSQNKYRETHSASYFNDFQARRLNIRYQAGDGSLKYVYTLNNTMAASPRLLAAIVENYQQADGSIRIPKILQPYLQKEVIGEKS